jgi:hypothetical protein
VLILEELHDTFRKWLGDGYDSEAMTAVLAAAAVERLDGDPLWLFLISGSGNAKTEMVQPLTGAGGIMTSTIQREPCFPARASGNAPPTQPAGCCANSETEACWSSRMSPRY